MFFKNAVDEFRINFPSALAFALLLVFVLPLSMFQQVSVSSGIISFEYGFNMLSIPWLLASLLLLVVFLFFYSTFVSLIIFGVRKDLSKVKLHYYLREQITKFSFRLFIFNLVYFLFMLAIGMAFAYFGIPLFAFFVLLFVSAIALFYFPQALVIDESSIDNSIASGWDFLMLNKFDTLKIIIVGTIPITLLPFIEFFLDSMFVGLGTYLALLVSFVIIVPFIEVWKTVLFIQKFELIKTSFKEFHAKTYPVRDRAEFEEFKILRDAPRRPLQKEQKQ